MGQRAEREVLHVSGMIGEFLEFRGCSGAVLLGEVSQAANIRWIHYAGKCWRRSTEFVRNGGFERDNRPIGRLLGHGNGCLDHREPIYLEISIGWVGLLQRFKDSPGLRSFAGARQRQSGQDFDTTPGSER